MINESELQLIKNAVSGDIKSFEKLIEIHYRMLHRLISCKVGNLHDRDDVIQDILLITWLNIGQLKKPEAFKSWLIRIANNRCNKWYRQSARIDEPIESETLSYIIDRQPRWDDGSDKADVLVEVIDKLPAGQRAVLLDFYFNNLKVSEISFVRHIPEGTVKRRLHDGRKNLKKNLEGKDE